MFMGLFMYFVGFFVFTLKSNYFLVMLLSLEFIFMSTYMINFLVLMMFLFEFYFSVIFLIMGVCEGALGLSLLVLMIRSYGNVYLKSLIFLW
uniref:NADH-ubiquinone oxidoreductase chain 4L n=1 Tax=Iberobaenia minuta TaxID=1857294 RepID=A0A3G1DH92_9COLE|nr:NADH deshydrogenase subunit 4L [Iberobaenia minuta]